MKLLQSVSTYIAYEFDITANLSTYSQYFTNEFKTSGPTGSVIYGNIKIGHDVTVKANSVVHKNIPPHCIVAGNPGRIKRTRQC